MEKTMTKEYWRRFMLRRIDEQFGKAEQTILEGGITSGGINAAFLRSELRILEQWMSEV